LVEASGGKIGTLADQLTLVCYRFDHLSQGYALRIMRVVQVAGIITLAVMATGVTLALRRERRRNVATAASVGAAEESEHGKQNGQPGVTA
jgi:protein SCO1/2